MTLTSITEFELKQRFRVAVDKWHCDRPWEKIIEILLYGDKR